MDRELTRELTLRGRRALVTGGSRGIGRAITLAMARAGATVVACHRADSEHSASLARELKELGSTAVGGGHAVVRADVTDPGEVAHLVQACRATLGGLDVLVNNAGVDGDHPFDDLPLDEWRRVLDADLTSLFLVTQAAAALLGPGASVVNIGAAIAARGRAGRTHHTAAKAGVGGLTRSLAKELGPRGVRVNTVAPGVIDTDPDGGPPPPVREMLARFTALGRLGTPDDVAGAVCFLASDLAGYVTGATLTVDGGI
jgi:3-oxoacyl-[acyl-carrier protein] reductase